MDADRRTEIAQAADAMLPELQEAVMDSWRDLVPASTGWTSASRARAERAARAALSGLVEMLAQGDLEDRAWERTRALLFAEGHATSDEVEDLLRSVRVVGIELLAERLAHERGLTNDERWQVQQEASAFCEQLLGTREELDENTFDEMLTALERSGPDLA